MGEESNINGAYNFDYDTDELVQAKVTTYLNANLCETTNALLAGANEPGNDTECNWTQIKSSSVGYSPCFDGAPLSIITKPNFFLLTDSQKKFDAVTKRITAFNDELDRIIGIISKYVDPSIVDILEQKMKLLEQEALQNYEENEKELSAYFAISAEMYQLILDSDPNDVTLTKNEDGSETVEVRAKDGSIRRETRYLDGSIKITEIDGNGIEKSTVVEADNNRGTTNTGVIKNDDGSATVEVIAEDGTRKRETRYTDGKVEITEIDSDGLERTTIVEKDKNGKDKTTTITKKEDGTETKLIVTEDGTRRRETRYPNGKVEITEIDKEGNLTTDSIDVSSGNLGKVKGVTQDGFKYEARATKTEDLRVVPTKASVAGAGSSKLMPTSANSNSQQSMANLLSGGIGPYGESRQTQMAAATQKDQEERWKIIQDTRSKDQEIRQEEKWKIIQDSRSKEQEIQQDLAEEQAKKQDKTFDKWDKYIRD